MGADGSMVGKVRTAARRVPLLRSVYRATRAELAARGFGAYADSTWNAIPNAVTVATIEGDTSVRVVGELGVFKGATTEAIARIIGPRDGVLHLFDFEDVVAPVAAHIARMGVSVVPHVMTRPPETRPPLKRVLEPTKVGGGGHDGEATQAHAGADRAEAARGGAAAR